MSMASTETDELRIRARNIGGIERTDVSFAAGVTVLTGRNATNRTSFLQALMAALGSEVPSLKGDADEGDVELEIGDDVYRRTLRRTDSGVVFDGSPYLDDPTAADRFAFLLGDNEARLAVERGDNLRDVIMEPIDTDEIEAEIDRLESEQRSIRDELDRLESLADELPELEQTKYELEAELEEKREELRSLEDEIEAKNVDVEQHRAKKEELEELFDDLREEQSTLETIEYDLATERDSLDELEAERDSLQAELAEMDEDLGSPAELEERVQALRDRKRALESSLNQLQNLISFNEDVVATGGSEVSTDHIEETIEGLQSARKSLVENRNDLQSDIESLTERRQEISQQKQNRERKRQRLGSLEDEIAETRERIETLESERDQAEADVEQLEDEVEEFDVGAHEEVLETRREANQLELEIQRQESELEAVVERVDDVESDVERRDELEAERSEIHESLTDLRNRVDRMEKDAVESFNEHVASILEVLGYENIERIWIERREREAKQGRRTVTEATFDLHVVRQGGDGSTYRDTVDHLSESERKVTGLVFALAGFLVHDLAETFPIMLLDSLEAIDADRMARLIEYFEDHVEYLVVALLPEDAEAVSDEYEYVTEI